MSSNFLTGFFMINALWIPPANLITVTRLLFWALIGNIVFKEGYSDVKTWNTVARKHNPVEARYRWLAFGIIFMELAISFKYVRDAGHLQLDDRPPLIVVIFWVIVFVTCFGYYAKLRMDPNRSKKFIEVEDGVSTPTRSARKSPRRSSTPRRSGRSTTPRRSRRSSSRNNY